MGAAREVGINVVSQLVLPVVVVGGGALAVWYLLNKYDIADKVADAANTVKEGGEDVFEKAKYTIPALVLWENKDEIINRLPGFDVPSEPIIHTPTAPNWELEESRVFVHYDAYGNLVDEAGNVIVPNTFGEVSDPWLIEQAARDAIVEAERAAQKLLDLEKAKEEARKLAVLADLMAQETPPPTATVTTIDKMMRNFHAFIDVQGKTVKEAIAATLHAFKFKLTPALETEFLELTGGG
jgi:hypothetical protein